jgi:hypothetical protein
MKKPSPEHPEENWALIRAILAFTIFIHGCALISILQPIYAYGKLSTSIKWQAATLLNLVIMGFEIFVLASTWGKSRGWIIGRIRSFFSSLSRLGAFNILLFLISIVAYPLIIYREPDFLLSSPLTQLALAWTITLIGSVWLRSLIDNREYLSKWIWLELIGASLLTLSMSYLIAVYCSEIYDYPFTLYWSETSRYYYGSLFLSKSIYGKSFPLPVLHPTQYLTHIFPYFLPKTSLLAHRAWHSFLWVALTLGTAISLSFRFPGSNNLRRWIFITWTFLFLLIGPVFYHLELALIVILLGFNQPRIKSPTIKKFLSICALITASIWAGVSRVNWIPVPGFLAAVIILFEEPVESRSRLQEALCEKFKWNEGILFRYAMKPVITVLIGSFIGLAAHLAYIPISGNPAEYFLSSYTSNLLWYRLLPNPTYPLGILPALLLISLPLLSIIVIKLSQFRGGVQSWKLLHPFRLLFTGAILLVLVTGGLMVSTKIGGGSNLHNMDAFLVFLLVVWAYSIFGQIAPDVIPDQKSLTIMNNKMPERQVLLRNIASDSYIKSTTSWIFYISAGLVFFIPVIYALTLPKYQTAIPDEEKVNRALTKIQEFSQNAIIGKGEVLFITDRHLVTLNIVKNVALVPEYEKVFLMEMAMAGNRKYMDAFYNDMKNQRFSVIITEPLYFEQKGRFIRFGEENNVWVEKVARKIDCYYEAQRTFPEVNIQILTPREEKSRYCP